MKTLFLYLLILNCFGFLLMGIDKRKSIKKKYRIQEKTFFLLSLFGGSLGCLLGMFTFHHKTKKMKFLIGIPFLLVLNIIILLYILKIK